MSVRRPFALKRRGNVAWDSAVSATGICLGSCSINRPFRAVAVAKMNTLRKQEKSGNILSGQGINDTAARGGAEGKMCAKRQKWLKQGIDDISVATVQGLWGSNFEVVPRVSPSWRQGKEKPWQASDRAIRDQWELLQSA